MPEGRLQRCRAAYDDSADRKHRIDDFPDRVNPYAAVIRGLADDALSNLLRRWPTIQQAALDRND